MSGLTLDAGALIAFDRNDRRTALLVSGALRAKAPLAIPAGVVGQAWRDGRTQARLAKLLNSDGVEIEPLDSRRARERGLFRRATVDRLLASPAAHLTPLRGSRLWQLALLDMWLQQHGL